MFMGCCDLVLFNFTKPNMAAKTDSLISFKEIPENATDEEKSRPLVDKLQLLDKEIRLLHEFCMKSGLNSKEIECCAKPFLKEQKEVKRKEWWSRVFYTSLIIAFIAFVLWYDPTYRGICVIGKLSSMKLLPYWDWTTEFEKECLIDNPYYEEDDQLTEEECEVCKELSGVRLKDVSQDLMASEYLVDEIPVIITDATKDWPMDLDHFDLNTLKEVYSHVDNKNTDKDGPCSFDAYFPNIESVQQLFSFVEEEKINHWQAYWENCEPTAVKSIRKFYRRPYFLPPMAESGTENWIFASQSSASTSAKNQWRWNEVSFGGSATWITQVKGNSKIVLTPQSPCDETCNAMSATLKPGEALVFGNRLWHFKQRPLDGEETICLASIVSWDQID